MAAVPRLAFVVGIVLLLVGGTAIGGGVYREATFKCDDTLSLNPGVNEQAKTDKTVAFADQTVEGKHGGELHRVGAVDAVCSQETTPRLASLMKRGGFGLALAGTGLAVAALVWERSDRFRDLLR